MPLVDLLGALDIVSYVVVPQVWNMNSIYWAFMRQLSSSPIKKGDTRLLPSWRYICPLTTSNQLPWEQKVQTAAEGCVTSHISFPLQTLPTCRINEVETLRLVPVSVRIKKYYRAMLRQKAHCNCLGNWTWMSARNLHINSCLSFLFKPWRFTC
jgi:hypothetical protein